MRGLENDDFVVILQSLVMITGPGEQISFHVLGARLVMESKVVFHELSDPSGLLSVQLLRKSEILEILVIRPDFYIFLGAHEVMVPFGECERDG